MLGWTRRDSSPGRTGAWRSQKAVREADVVVVCLSNKSVTKEGYVQKEIKFALDIAEEKPEGTIFLIPARLEDCVVPERLSRWQWVDLYEENGFVKLLRSLKLRADAVGAKIEPTSYEDTDKEIERRLKQLYTEGLAAFYTEDWDKACHRFQSILSERPSHKNASEKLVEAERQRNLSRLYAQASEAVRSENWESAIKILEELSQRSAEYKDAASLLRNARKQKQLKDLYAEASTLHDAQKWDAVIKVFEQIAAIEPNYPDPNGLLPSAQKEEAELKRLADLNELYGNAVSEMDAGHWIEARRLLEQVHKSQTGFLETERLLRKVEDEITKMEEQSRRSEQVNVLYEQAHGLLRSKKWRKALDKIEEIEKLDTHFEDRDRIAQKAKAELEHEEQDAQKQNQLAAMYAEAVRLLKEEKYQEALHKWQEVRTMDPKYPDRQGVQRTARRKMAQIGQSEKRKRIKLSAKLRNIILIIGLGGLILVGFAGAFIYMNQPAILPRCSYVYTDPFLMESKFKSSTVVVDGKITYPSEWAKSRCYQFDLNAQAPGSRGCGDGYRGIPLEAYLLNDEQRLYLLLRLKAEDFAPTGVHFSYFYPYPYTDHWQFSDQMAFDTQPIDNYGWNESEWFNDVDDGGTMDTRSGSYHAGQSYWFEFSKPLNSGDGHDWAWKPGDKVGSDLTGDLLLGSWGTLSPDGDRWGCRMIQLQLAK